ncbi:MAG TPA: metallophosphoesterase [Ornithinibacter sp.]|nr:metallophosphoesterase [Ornithinibacter sp.]
MTLSTNRLLTSVASVALVVGTAFGGMSTASAGTVDCASFRSEVTQLVKPSSAANLLTRSPDEAARAKAIYGFTEDRGVVARVAAVPGAGLTRVWRMYRSGDFVWATEGADADAFLAAGYRRHFVEFYASPTPQSCLRAVNRLERGGIHRVATGSQTAALVKAGWVSRGTSFYAAVGKAPTAPARPPVVPPPPVVQPPPVIRPQPPGATDTKFSVAVIPDTQDETSSTSGTRFSNRVGWLVANRADLDLRYAIQIGDLSSWGHVTPAQFEKASTEIKPLEAVIPWSVAAGNHDTGAVCAGGSACPGAKASVTVRDLSTFNRYFPPSRFGNLRGTYEPNRSENSYATFSAGGKEWLVLTLELWARPEVVAWANGVVAANPSRNVIINTHAYLEADGSISASNGGYGSTSPRYLFDNLVKVHPNIKMVLSGHVGQAAVRTDTGVSGNKVVSFLQAFHSGTNPVRLVEIDTAAGTVNSRVYAPQSNTSYPQYTTSTTGISFR